MPQEPLVLHPEAEQEYREAYARGIGSEALALLKNLKKRLSVLSTRSNGRPSAGLSPIPAFANTRCTNFPTVFIIGAMRRGRLCWRLRMGVVDRVIGRGAVEAVAAGSSPGLRPGSE